MKTNLLFLFLFLFSFGCFACSTFIAGKNTTFDGSVIIARNVDWEDPFMPFNMRFHKKSATSRDFSSSYTFPPPPTSGGTEYTFNYTIPKVTPYFAFPIYTSTEESYSWEEVGINSKCVAISATESISSNQDTLNADPLKPSGGFNESCITSVILPQMTSAFDGAQLLGSLIYNKKGQGYRSGEGFGVAFADKDECWYLENAGGTKWLAQRVPDQCYFFSANQGRLNGSEPEQIKTISSLIGSGPIKFNFAKSYMDDSEPLNENYNKCRVDRVITDLVPGSKYSSNSPFMVPHLKDPITKEPTLITIDTVKTVLRDSYGGLSPYYNIPYTPDMVAATGNRPISVIRCSLSHITQMGRHYPPAADGTPGKAMPPAIGNVMYVAYGFTDLSIYMPLHQGLMSEDGTNCYIPEAYQGATSAIDNTSMFWLLRELQTLVMVNYKNYSYDVKKTLYGNDNKSIEGYIKQQQIAMETQYHNTSGSADTKRQLIINFTKQCVEYAIDELNFLINDLKTKIKNNPPPFEFDVNNIHENLKNIESKFHFEGA